MIKIKKLLIWYLILLPILDYTYLIQIIKIKEINLSFLKIIKMFPIVVFFILLPFFYKKMYFWKKTMILFLSAFISLIIGIFNYSIESLDGYLRYISSFIFLVLLAKNTNSDDIIFMFKTLTIITLVPIIVSYLQLLNILPYTDFDYIFGIKIGRVSGGYTKQVAMISYLIYTFTYANILIFNHKKLYVKIFAMIYVIISLTVIFLSTHRASILIFNFISLYFIYLNKPRYFFLFIFFLVPTLILKFKDTLTEVFINTSGITGDINNLFRGRVGFWMDYITNLFNSNIIKIIFGNGNSVIDTNNTNYLSNYNLLSFNEPHSDIVRILYQYGVIGLLIYLNVIFTFLKVSIRYEKNSIKDKIVAQIAKVSTAAIFLYSFTIEPTRYPSFLFYLSLVCGYIVFNENKKIQKIKLYENSVNN